MNTEKMNVLLKQIQAGQLDYTLSFRDGTSIIMHARSKEEAKALALALGCPNTITSSHKGRHKG